MAEQKFPITMQKSDGSTKVAYTKGDVVQGEWDGYSVPEEEQPKSSSRTSSKKDDSKSE